MRKNWLLSAVCDGDCDNCRHDDCIDDAGVWDYVTPAERAVLMDRSHPEWRRVYSRVIKRRRIAADPEYRERVKRQSSERRARLKSDPERYAAYLARRREYQKEYSARHPEKVRAKDRRYYLEHREEILEYYRQRKQKKSAAPGAATPKGGKGKQPYEL